MFSVERHSQAAIASFLEKIELLRYGRTSQWKWIVWLQNLHKETELRTVLFDSVVSTIVRNYWLKQPCSVWLGPRHNVHTIYCDPELRSKVETVLRFLNFHIKLVYKIVKCFRGHCQSSGATVVSVTSASLSSSSPEEGITDIVYSIRIPLIHDMATLVIATRSRCY